MRSRSNPPGPKPLIRRRWVREDKGFVWSRYWDNWLDPKNSLTVAFTMLKFNNWLVSILLVWLRNFRTNLWNPILNKFCKSSPTERTRLFFKWSISSGTVLERVTSINLSMIAKISSYVIVCNRSLSFKFREVLILKRPTLPSR